MAGLRLPLPELAAQFMLRPGITFLNHGSFGACPQPVFAAYQQWQRELEGQPVEFLQRRLPGLLVEARSALAVYLGTTAGELVFVPNATHGINIVARSLPLNAGDEVLATDHEYGAVDRTWRFLATQRGFHYRRHRLRLPLTDPEALVEDFWSAVTPRTRVIAISQITSPTALTLPVAAICARARAAGIITVIDGAHAPGQIALDLGALGADFYTGNCHKWLCAPKGAAFLFARTAVQHLLQPLIVSWGWEPQIVGESPFIDLFGWTGTADPAAYLSVPAAIAFQAQHDWPAVRAACHQALGAFHTALADLGPAPLCPADARWFSQMAALPLPACEPIVLQRRLWEEYQIEVPIIAWEGRHFVRVSVQAYTTPADLARLEGALRALLAAP